MPKDALKDLQLLVRSRYGLIYVDTPEEERAEGPVVVGGAEPAVDVRGREDEAASLREGDDGVEIGWHGIGRLGTLRVWQGGMA